MSVEKNQANGTAPEADNRKKAGWMLAFAAAGALLVFCVAAGLPGVALAETKPNTCVECHSNEDFLVTNKKLYDYFEEWKVSVHSAENVGCVECHGGNPEAKDKDKAHPEGSLRASDENSPTYYLNIPNTCANCHKDEFKQYKTSKHFEELKESKAVKHGPTCVTCHGSVSTGVLNVNNVKKTCQFCHNTKKDIAPEVPNIAEKVLHDMLSINRYYRYIITRSNPKDAKAFMEKADPQIRNLSVQWHAFDLKKVQSTSEELLSKMKKKRNEMRKSE
ncbi:MAG: cytochrome c3 family protein [Deltaproteobacteria bacterium]|nr:cytochrome c3 family protein [Deltaproteobacteria bacterium]